MTNPQPKSGTAAELAALSTRRQQLGVRRVAAEAKCAEARRARIEMLKVGGELEKHNQVLRDATNEIASMDELLLEIDAEMTAADARQAAEQEAEERQRAATSLEALRPVISKAAAELDAAADQLGKAFAALVRAMPDGFRLVDVHGKPAGREAYAAALLAEAVFAAAPVAFDVYRQDGGHQVALHRVFQLGSKPDYRARDWRSAAEASSPGAAAELLLLSRLTDLAEKIREGRETASSAAFRPIPPKAPKGEPAAPAVIAIVARENFALRLSATGPVDEVSLLETRSLPQDAAALAITTGVAYRADDSRIEDLRWDVKRGRHRVVGGKFAIERQSDGQMRSRSLGDGARTSVSAAILERSF